MWVMPAWGGAPRKTTLHTEGFILEEWMPDGKSLLTSITRDHFWRRGERFSIIQADGKQKAEQVLFDDYGQYPSVSPDGKQVLYNREGERWWRKGYTGSRTSQIWLWDSTSNKHTKLLSSTDSRWPLWKPDGKAFYYIGAPNGVLNLREYEVSSKKDRQITKFKDNSVVFPTVSRDGSVIAFRHLFDFYQLKPGKAEKPVKINLWAPGDISITKTQRRVLNKATDVAFSKDGLEIAFIAGGDVWVMDTELREPIQITNTPEEEDEPIWSKDGNQLIFLSGQGGQEDLWLVERTDTKKYWWQNKSFKSKRLTNDASTEYGLSLSPDGGTFAYFKDRGDFWVMDTKTQKSKRLFKSWNSSQYDWSPDGKWIVYAVSDNDFNRDIWIRPIDGSREPFNLSRHPDNEYNPRWSPDGKVIAFTGRRRDQEVDIFYVYLRAEDDQKNSRARKLAKALEKMQKGRPAKPATLPPAKPVKADPKKEDKPKPVKPEAEPKTPIPPPKKPALKIDFEEIHERIRVISIPDSAESSLLWSPDSKRLAFSANIDGKRGTYAVSFPDGLKPTLLTSTSGSNARWLGSNIRWLVNGVPATLSSTGRPSSYSFSAKQEIDLGKTYHAAFDLCWRAMRDNWYDPAMGNRNWDAVRKKYGPMAAASTDGYTLGLVINLMLGELNGSHLGFSYRGPELTPTAPRQGWTDTTAHLGVRFISNHKGPGLKVRDIIPKGPADRETSRIKANEIITHIDGKKVSLESDLTSLLTGRPDRDIVLKIQSGNRRKKQIREVTLRPTSFSSARSRLYEKWIHFNRAEVSKLSDDKLGYMHIAGMNMTSFFRFEEELYSVGAGKDGIIIDVRENGGGSTTDHLLTILTQPQHAITVPRGGGQGYPQDRKVYASWHKPVVVLCNQNSYSNAEIFSHAIKYLKRGKVVGVPTAGGVISTGGRSIMDMGFLRMPFRGWYLMDTGEDMELHGAVPHYVLWPKPGELPAGKDTQLRKAIGVLKKEVKKYNNRPQPELKNATSRQKK